MDRNPKSNAGFWVARVLLALLAVCYGMSWDFGQIGMMRSYVTDTTSSHTFFLTSLCICILGIGYSFVSSRRGTLVAGTCLILSSVAMWCTLALMFIRTTPFWLWITCSVFFLALPIGLGIVVVGGFSSHRTKKIWRILVSTVTATGITAAVAWPTLRISYHRSVVDSAACWMESRGNLNQFRYDFMMWSFKGGPPHDQLTRTDHHREALLELGYFERRKFSLESSSIDSKFWQSIGEASFKDQLWTVRPAHDRRSFELIACAGDIEKWEEVVGLLDQRINHQSGKNSD